MTNTGSDVTVVQAMLGHANSSITARYYVHVNNDRIQADLDKIDG